MNKPSIEQIAETVVRTQKCGVQFLQREFHIDFNRAAHIVNELEMLGIVGKFDGVSARRVLVRSIDVAKAKIMEAA